MNQGGGRGGLYISQGGLGGLYKSFKPTFDRNSCVSAPYGLCTGSLSRLCFATRRWFASASCASAPTGPCSGSRCSSYVCYSFLPVLP